MSLATRVRQVKKRQIPVTMMSMGGAPRIVIVKNLKNQVVVADKCVVAERFFDRFRGLIGRSTFVFGQGMLFPRCNNIHMWFMSIPIDVVFIVRADDGVNWRVVATRGGVRPWKLLPLMAARASETLELPMGAIDRAMIREGDKLCIS